MVNGITTDGDVEASVHSPPEQPALNTLTISVEAQVDADTTADAGPPPMQSAIAESTVDSGPSAPAAAADETTGHKVPSGALTTSERRWRDRAKWLEEKGYMLRPRYRPDWRPSWEARRRFGMNVKMDKEL